MNGFQNINPAGILVRTNDGRNFMLQENVDFLSSDGNTYRIPAGALSDGASTPSAIWINFPPFGSYWKPAYLHDSAYRNTLLIHSGIALPDTIFKLANLPKEKCDDLIKEAMQYGGTHEFTLEAIYEGVAIGGKSSFDNDRKSVIVSFHSGVN